MKRLFTAILLLCILVISSNSFANPPKEYMTIWFSWGTKHYAVFRPDGTKEEGKINTVGNEAFGEMLVVINSFTKEGWEIAQYNQASQITVIMVREK